jgi:hypothetical protein
MFALSVPLIPSFVKGQSVEGFPDPTMQQTYTMHRSSSREATGANADFRTITPGQTLTILDVDGPGRVSHIWFTLNAQESIEHGHANARSDNFYSVAYWYQAEPHLQFPALPEMSERIPAVQAVGGPGNAKQPRKEEDPQPR